MEVVRRTRRAGSGRCCKQRMLFSVGCNLTAENMFGTGAQNFDGSGEPIVSQRTVFDLRKYLLNDKNLDVTYKF